MEILELLLSKVKVDANGCFVWQGTMHGAGYGHLSVPGVKTKLAHRIMYGVSRGDPTGFEVCHRCDNPPCINPAHLFLGTHADNMADSAKKDRTRFGSRQWQSKLKEADIPRIFEMCHAGSTAVEIAKAFGVTDKLIYLVLSGKVWRREVKQSVDISGRRPHGEKHHLAKMTAEKVTQIRQLSRDGVPLSELRRTFGISNGALWYILNRKTWSHVA